MTREEHLAAIKQADHEYYDLDNPSMSDAEYDSLRRSYIDQYGTEDLDYVPGNVSDKFEKFKHPHEVISLDKWTRGVDKETSLIKKLNELWPVEIQPKYDGFTVVAYSNPDGSCKFVTRGGGTEGEVLPNFIPEYEGEGVNTSGYPVRGEVIITPENFKKLNEELVAAGEEPMKNPRNCASGLLRRKERSPHLHLLSYIAYDIPGLDVPPQEIRQVIFDNTKFTVTGAQQFDTVEETIAGVEQMYANINENQTAPIDGIVIKSCQPGSLAKFGSTDHHPRNSMAWKCLQEDDCYETYIRDVIWQTGRERVTPVALIEPTEIDGTTVTRATLDNAAQIKKLGIKINSKILIRKAGAVIPKIVRVLEDGDIDIVIGECPCCGAPLIEEDNGLQYCSNPKCEERIAQAIAFLADKDVLNIDQLGIEAARKIVGMYDTTPYGSSPQNIIFELEVEDIRELPGYAKKSAETLYNNIQNARENVDLPHFIKALNIPAIGATVGKKLAEKYGSIGGILGELDYEAEPDEVMREAKAKKLQEIDGIGPVTARTLVSEEFWTALNELREYIEPLEYKKEEIAVGEFVGKTFVLTGKAEEHPRAFYETLILNAGAKVGSGVTSKTYALVAADANSTSSKAKKARELGIKIISYEELERMCYNE